jgi:hypothetical protein
MSYEAAQCVKLSLWVGFPPTPELETRRVPQSGLYRRRAAVTEPAFAEIVVKPLPFFYQVSVVCKLDTNGGLVEMEISGMPRCSSEVYQLVDPALSRNHVMRRDFTDRVAQP